MFALGVFHGDSNGNNLVRKRYITVPAILTFRVGRKFWSWVGVHVTNYRQSMTYHC